MKSQQMTLSLNASTAKLKFGTPRNGTMMPAPVVVDLLPGVVKEVLHLGRGECCSEDVRSRPAEKGTKFIFHFQTILNYASDVNEQKVIDDSRDWIKPMELIAGHQFKLEIWESLLASMRLSEVAVFHCDYNSVYAYPKVAAQLRKILKEQVAVEPETHCCAASVKNISVGYHDLDSLIQTPPSRLTFRLELLEMHREGSFHKESWTLSDEEKLDRVRKLKEEGNALYKRKSVREAMEKYSEAVALLDQLILKEKPGSQAHVSLNETRSPIVLNFCQCCLHLKEEMYRVIDLTSQLLTSAASSSSTGVVNKQHTVKALYKRAMAHKMVHNYKEAQNDMTKAAEMDPSLSNTADIFVSQVRQIQSRNDQHDKSIFRNMIGRNSTSSASSKPNSTTEVSSDNHSNSSSTSSEQTDKSDSKT